MDAHVISRTLESRLSQYSKQLGLNWAMELELSDQQIIGITSYPKRQAHRVTAYKGRILRIVAQGQDSTEDSILGPLVHELCHAKLIEHKYIMGLELGEVPGIVRTPKWTKRGLEDRFLVEDTVHRLASLTYDFWVDELFYKNFPNLLESSSRLFLESLSTAAREGTLDKSLQTKLYLAAAYTTAQRKRLNMQPIDVSTIKSYLEHDKSNAIERLQVYWEGLPQMPLGRNESETYNAMLERAVVEFGLPVRLKLFFRDNRPYLQLS